MQFQPTLCILRWCDLNDTHYLQDSGFTALTSCPQAVRLEAVNGPLDPGTITAKMMVGTITRPPSPGHHHHQATTTITMASQGPCCCFDTHSLPAIHQDVLGKQLLQKSAWAAGEVGLLSGCRVGGAAAHDAGGRGGGGAVAGGCAGTSTPDQRGRASRVTVYS